MICTLLPHRRLVLMWILPWARSMPRRMRRAMPLPLPLLVLVRVRVQA